MYLISDVPLYTERRTSHHQLAESKGIPRKHPFVMLKMSLKNDKTARCHHYDFGKTKKKVIYTTGSMGMMA